MKTLIPAVLSIMFALNGCGPAADAPVPPVAKIDPTVFQEFGRTRTDDYAWLRERESTEVLDHLRAENAYTEEVLAPVADLREALFREIVGRIKENDDSVPYLDRGHWYSSRYEEGREYPIHCRRAGSLDAPEQILLDVNERAEAHGYFNAAGLSVSSTGNVLAWAEDEVGRRIYTIRFKDLDSGAVLDEAIEGVTPDLVWAEDGKTLFYTRKDEQTLRPFQVWRHALGTDASTDVLVHQEDDETFAVGLDKTTSRDYLLIVSRQTVSTEVRFLDARRPDAAPVVFLPRERNHEYDVDHLGDRWYVQTNREARNFRLVSTDDPAAGESAWQDLIPHRDDVLLMRCVQFDDWLVALERRDGLRRLRVMERATGESHEVDMGETAFAIWPSINRTPGSSALRLGYESMTTPESIFDYDMRTRESTLLKRDEVLGEFSSDDYVSDRLMVPARDGTPVPVSFVHHSTTALDGTAPVLLYAYGSYGYSMEPYFNSARLSLLDRGFVWAVAHVRGGQEMGRRWYEDGKLMKKKNTFTDFIDCGRALVDRRVADPERLYAMGGSAGGLLVGAVINMVPDLFHGAVAQVPFVDVVTTMLDESIPLTTGEYDEWGDPNERAAYEYMLSYSPYDNVEAQAYPNLLVTAGLHDSQVQYWEPAKWVAKLRALKTDRNLLLLNTNMEAGHGGASGRFRRHRETALEYAFLLELAGKR